MLSDEAFTMSLSTPIPRKINLQEVSVSRRDGEGNLLFKPGGTLQVYFYKLSKTYYGFDNNHGWQARVRLVRILQVINQIWYDP